MHTKTADVPHQATSPRLSLARTWARSLQFFAEAFLELFGFIWLAFAFVVTLVGVGVWLLPGALDFAAANADRSRELARRLTGVRIFAERRRVTGPAGAGSFRHTLQRLADPLVRRDLIWHLLNPFFGLVLSILSVGLVAEAVWEIAALPFQIAFAEFRPATWFTIADANALPLAAAITVAVIAIAAQIGVGILLARPVLRLQGAWARAILSMDETEALRRRAATLEETRADARDLEQAELERIERDLHDGAQMRFVSTGLTISEAARFVHNDPDRAVELLAQAKDESAAGLAELRALVRGIRPPVLAGRGLVDAVRALARDTPVPTVVTSDVATRLAAPLESAMYFAVAEALTNAVKHADAAGIRVALSETDERVEAVITDDGRGGAEVEGSGLAGIRKRLSTFDASVEIVSPVARGTVVRISAPKIGAALSDPVERSEPYSSE